MGKKIKTRLMLCGFLTGIRFLTGILVMTATKHTGVEIAEYAE